MLPRLQINPSRVPENLSCVGVPTPIEPLPVLAPLILEVSADSLELGLLTRAEEECGKICVEDLRLGYHWWASTAMTVAVLGRWTGDLVDTACQTYVSATH